MQQAAGAQNLAALLLAQQDLNDALAELHHAVQGAAPAGPAAAGGDAAGGAEPVGAAAEGQRAPKRQRSAQSRHVYEPRAEADLVLKTSDGCRVGVHRLLLRRSCGFFAALLDACESEAEVSVVEPFEELKAHLLDIIYDRSVQITPETVMKVFQLADKYEAADIMAACRPVFMSGEFRMQIAEPLLPLGADAEPRAHAAWLDVLALASKHGYADLFDKASDFLVTEAKDNSVLAVQAAGELIRCKEQLAELHQAHLLALTAKFARCTHEVYSQMQNKLEDMATQSNARQSALTKQQKKTEAKDKLYLKLLSRFNRLVNRCEREKVTWHKEIDKPPDGSRKKKKKKKAAA